MKIDINDIISDDFKDVLITYELKKIHSYMEEYLKSYKEEDHGFISVFSLDPEEDKAQIDTLREALEVVLEYFGEET
tara:strand:+ start:2025 stop:2255 length:231 start_codon:yes stop_codon:yes gene_type:complete